MTEAELQEAVITVARALGFRVAHFRHAQTARGVRTAMQGDVGFPDLTLAGHGRLLFVELKSKTGTVAFEQRVWLTELGLAGVEVYVWRPIDWTTGRIEAVLRGRSKRSIR